MQSFNHPGLLKKTIVRITTDSRPMEDPKEPDDDQLYQLYSLFAAESEREEMAALYRRGGFGYGEIKQAVFAIALLEQEKAADSGDVCSQSDGFRRGL